LKSASIPASDLS